MRAKIQEIRRNGLTAVITLAPEPTAENDAEIKRIERLQGKWVTIEVKDATQKSLAANSYMWVLCGQIAQKLELTAREVYQHAIRDAGRWTDVEVTAEAFPALAQAWDMKGIGWWAETYHAADEFGMAQVRLYYGSSVYTAEELGRVIDSLVEDCRNLHIETKTQEEMDSMLGEWREKYG